MKHRLFNVAAVVSLVLCVATVVLWVRSYKETNHALTRMWLEPESLRSGNHSAGALGGELLVWWSEREWVDRAHYEQRDPVRHNEGWSLAFRYFVFDSASPPPLWERAGFGVHRQSDTLLPYKQRVSGIALPLWFITLITAILPTLGVVSWVRLRRTRNDGCCPTCGYDLRATPDRCPECGTVPAGKSESADGRSRGAAID